MQSSFDHYPRLLRAGLQCLLTIVFAGAASLATAQTTTLYQHNFASGLGDFSASGRVSSVSDGVRLRGGAGTSYIISSAISVAGTSNLALRVSRSTSGLDAGETATISYSFDGQNFNVLESLRSASGQVTLPISGSGSQLYLRFTLNASSILETYTINQVAVQGTGGSSGPDPEPPADCGTGLSAGLTTRNLTIDGRQRQYILSIPHSYTGNEPLPLLLDFHALHTGAAYQRDNSGMRELSEQENFIVAFPQGIDNA